MAVETLPITPSLGYPVPNARHAVSVQLPTWDLIKEMFTGAERVKKVQQTGYPRSFIHKDIKELNRRILATHAPASSSCYIFSDIEQAKECKTFASSREIHGENATAPHLITIRSIKISLDVKPDTETNLSIILHALFVPTPFIQPLADFWRLAGTGISSRLAEYCLQNMSFLQDVTGEPSRNKLIGRWRDPSHRKLCQRIASLLGRAAITTPVEPVARDDIYLYQSGMSAIYHANQFLTSLFDGQSVQFGFPYELTLKLLQTFSSRPVKFFPFGDEEELEQLENLLRDSSQGGRPVQAIWVECASNPLLRTPDMKRLKQLSDQYSAAIVVDDTIGSFANIDLMGVADIVVTSLTKSFSGFADVMGGSLVLNPNSNFYPVLKDALDNTYVNRLFEGDSLQLEINSRDFLARTSRMNDSASYLVRSLQPLVSECGTLTALYYPEICWSSANYRAQMRRCTADFAPGFGCLFTMQFQDVARATAFFNALNVHKGPSLGASVTLSQPYVQTVFHKQKEWAAQCGLHETIVRISVGLEDQEALLAAFEDAFEIADKLAKPKQIVESGVLESSL